MHEKYGVRPVVEKMDRLDLRTFLNFRVKFLNEELDETKLAANNAGYIDEEEVVDGLIDLCVVAIGTLDAFGVDPYKAWDAVLEANMNKEVGIKETRPNPLGLPDLIKPEGWVAPSHKGNHGDLKKIS
jgi:predicted HAD superfamily Cof-like phosphohydrolase